MGEALGRLAGKVALVTGAANGIGAAIARRFVAEGALVVLVDRDADAGAALAAELGASATLVVCDVAQDGAASKAVDATVERFGRLDVLVNNAGITHAASFLDIDVADFDRVLAINLRAYFCFGQAAACRMAAQGDGGTIVNMSSVNAVLAIPDQVPYVVSKGAVNQLTKVMALSLADHGIRVNAIGPGTIATDLATKAVMGSEAARRKIMSRTPLRRLGEPAEVADVALFLACSESSYLTGQVIYPDGGRLALNYTIALD
jgi:NAD(P)-dependent dehydrogenase (short-subunit alcohol dehydrogenase family)